MKFQTLHCHTTVSDGKLTYKQVLDTCQANNIGVVAFTDHDSVPDVEAIKTLDSLRSHETKWIVGIEISSGYPKEKKDAPASSFHIVGLFIDPTNKELIDYCEKAQAARVERMEDIVKNLTNLGFHVTAQMCLDASKGEAVARPHIVEAVFSKPENVNLIYQLRDKMQKESVGSKALQQKYAEMEERVKERGEVQYAYALFLSDDAYIPGVYVERKYWKDLDSVAKLIRTAGGLAILAHYTFSKRNVPAESVERLLRENRLDGAEMVYGLNALGENDFAKELDADEKFIEGLVKKYNKVASGGVDAHCKQDFELFSSNRAYAARTIGMVEQIIEQTKVDTKWSSICNKITK